MTFTKHFGEGYDEYTKKPGVPDLSDSDADIMTDIDLLDNDKD